MLNKTYIDQMLWNSWERQTCTWWKSCFRRALSVVDQCSTSVYLWWWSALTKDLPLCPSCMGKASYGPSIVPQSPTYPLV